MLIYFSSECLSVNHRNDTKPRYLVLTGPIVLQNLPALFRTFTVRDTKRFVIYEKHVLPVSAVG